MRKETEQVIEINVFASTQCNSMGKTVKFVPKSEGIKMVESDQASWLTRTLSFEEQLHTPMAEVVVSHPFIPNEKAVKFVPRWQAESMVRMGQAELPVKK